MNRRVYLEPPWKMHAGHRRLVTHPPSGYEVATSSTLQEELFDVVTRLNVLRFFCYALRTPRCQRGLSRRSWSVRTERRAAPC
jgi:hypothetical protein